MVRGWDGSWIPVRIGSTPTGPSSPQNASRIPKQSVVIPCCPDSVSTSRKSRELARKEWAEVRGYIHYGSSGPQTPVLGS